MQAHLWMLRPHLLTCVQSMQACVSLLCLYLYMSAPSIVHEQRCSHPGLDMAVRIAISVFDYPSVCLSLFVSILLWDSASNSSVSMPIQVAVDFVAKMLCI